MKIIKKKKREIKSTCEMKTTMDMINNWVDIAGEKSSEFEDSDGCYPKYNKKGKVNWKANMMEHQWAVGQLQ